MSNVINKIIGRKNKQTENMNQTPDKKDTAQEPAWVKDLYLKTMLLDADDKPKFYSILFARMNDTSFTTGVAKAEDVKNIYERCYKLLDSGVDLIKVSIRYKNPNEPYSEFIVKGTDTYMPLADEKPQGTDYLNGLNGTMTLHLDARDMKYEIKNLTEKLAEKNELIAELKKDADDYSDHQERLEAYIGELENTVRGKEGGSDRLMNMGIAMLGGKMMGYNDDKIMSLAGLAMGDNGQTALQEHHLEKGNIAIENENLTDDEKKRRNDEKAFFEFVSKLTLDDFLKVCAIAKGTVNMKVPFSYIVKIIQEYKPETND